MRSLLQSGKGFSETMNIELFRLPHDQGLLWQLIHQGDVFSVRDMQKRPRFPTAFRKWRIGVLQSDLWVPLMRGGEVLGILTLGECQDGAQIGEGEYPFLQEIAAVAATNIDSTLKYEKNARILANLRTLYEVNQQLANVNDFKKLTIETARLLREMVREGALYASKDGGRNQVTIVDASHRPPPPSRRRPRQPSATQRSPGRRPRPLPRPPWRRRRPRPRTTFERRTGPRSGAARCRRVSRR